MATLTNTKIKDTYKSLLKVSDNGNLEAGLQEITDGEGNASGVQLNTGGDLTASGTVSFGSLKDTGENITISKFVDAADGIGSNNNDTTIPTSAAVKLYVDTNITAQDLDFTTDSGTGAVDLDSQTFSILGTANEIETSGTGQTVTIGLPSTITANVTGNVSGNLTGTVLTAAQTNITSVGTLSSLAVSGNLTVDTNTLFVDAANNWVGIGTSSPSRPIHILAPTPGIKLEDTTGSDFGEIVSVDGDLYIRADEGATQADSSIRFQIDQSEKVRIDSGGNMGIGTAPDADAELHIYKNGDAARVRIEREFNPQLDLESLSGYARIGTLNNFPLAFQTNAAERMRITSSGNVGIGTSNADYLLTAFGNAQRIGLKVPSAGEDWSDTDLGGFVFRTHFGTQEKTGMYAVGNFATDTYQPNLVFRTNAADRLVIKSSGNVGIGTSSPASLLHIYNSSSAEIKLETTAGSALLRAISDTLVYRGDSHIFQSEGATERLRIDSSGNLGIGISSPATKVDIAANNNGGTALNVLRFTDTDITSAPNQENGRIEFYTSDGSSAGVASYISGVTGTGAEGRLIFATGLGGAAAERLRIDSDGNVGIGESSPLRNLHITDSSLSTYIRIETGNTNISGIEFADTDDANVGRISYDHSDNSMEFRVNDAERMRIDSSGRVGIGTSSPASRLHIEDNDPKITLRDTSGASNAYFQILAAGGDGQVATLDVDPNNVASGSFLNIKIDATERMRIDASGFVGIGESTPLVPLHISKNTASGENIALILDNNDTTVNSEVGLLFRSNVGSTNTDFQIATINTAANQAQLVFRSDGGSERMRIDSSGRVGIGTASPLSTIHSSAPKPTYTDFGVVFRGGTTNSNSFSGISLMSAGDALDGQIGSNYLVDGTTVSQTNSNRSSAYIQFNNTTAAGQTSAISFGGLVRGSTTKVERLRILSTGGLTFNGDTAAANALNDYEEGSFTPEVADATTGGNTATGTFNGYYTKIGNKVTVQISLSNIDTTGMTGANALFITNLPFTADLLSGLNLFQGAALLSYITESANTYNITSSVTDNTSYLRFAQSISGSLNDYLEVSQLQSGSSDIWTTVTYLV
jgi:hypothetical protein